MNGLQLYYCTHIEDEEFLRPVSQREREREREEGAQTWRLIIQMRLNLLLACLLAPSLLTLALPTPTLYGGAKVATKPVYPVATTKFTGAVGYAPNMFGGYAPGGLAYNKYAGTHLGGLGYGGGLYAAKPAYGGLGLFNPMSFKSQKMLAGYGSYGPAALAYNKAPGFQFGAYPTLGKHYNTMATHYPSPVAGYGKLAYANKGFVGLPQYAAGKMMGGGFGLAGHQMVGFSAGPGHLAQQMVGYGPGHVSKQMVSHTPGLVSKQTVTHGPGYVESKQVVGYGPGIAAGPAAVYAKQAAPLYGSFGMLGKGAFTSYG